MLQLLGWEPIQCKGVFPVPMLVKPTQRPAHYEAIDFLMGSWLRPSSHTRKTHRLDIKQRRGGGSSYGSYVWQWST